MIGFLKTVFTNKRKVEVSSEKPQISATALFEDMPFLDVVSRLHSFDVASVNVNIASAIIRRLYRIAWFDNHVPSEHRTAASGLADGLVADVERSLSGNPQAALALQAAIANTRELARRGGCGSLAWKLNEFTVSGKDTIPYIMKPEHRHLISDFFYVIGREKIAEFRTLMLQEMIEQSEHSFADSVVVLHGLAANGDKALATICDPADYRLLLDVPSDYASARDVLMKFRILEPLATPFRFKAIEELEGGPTGLINLLKQAREAADKDNRLIGLGERERYCILLSLLFMSIDLATSVTSQAFGKDAVYDVVSLFYDIDTVDHLDRFKHLSSLLKQQEPGTPIDFMLLDDMMRLGGLSAESKEQFEARAGFMTMAARWLNNSRVELLDKLLKATVPRVAGSS